MSVRKGINRCHLKACSIFVNFTKEKCKHINNHQLYRQQDTGHKHIVLCFLSSVVVVTAVLALLHSSYCVLLFKMYYFIDIKCICSTCDFKKQNDFFCLFPFMAQALCWSHHHPPQCHLLIIIFPARYRHFT